MLMGFYQTMSKNRQLDHLSAAVPRESIQGGQHHAMVKEQCSMDLLRRLLLKLSKSYILSVFYIVKLHFEKYINLLIIIALYNNNIDKKRIRGGTYL
jgi:hypothetical protein